MKFNSAQQLLLGTLAMILSVGISTANAQVLNYDPSDTSTLVDVGAPSNFGMVCDALNADCNVNPDTDPLVEFDCGSVSCQLTIDDCCIIGDMYQVFDFGTSVGSTSDPDITGQLSTGTFCFSAGPHQVTVRDVRDINFPAGLDVTITLDETDLCPNIVTAGELVPLNTTALFISGLSSSAIWIVPTLAGIAGVGAYYIKSKKN
jgi:hypothetical protein